MKLFLITLAILVGYVSAFAPTSRWVAAQTATRAPADLKMGLFDMFAPKKSASARHILMKDQAGYDKLVELKASLSKKNAGAMEAAFADAAAQYSTCPSGKQGGSLGTFKQVILVINAELPGHLSHICYSWCCYLA
jgi:parvulin-like peptidyl-prolyl isomerase